MLSRFDSHFHDPFNDDFFNDRIGRAFDDNDFGNFGNF